MIKLTATNYSLWKSMMEDFLNCKNLVVSLGNFAQKGKVGLGMVRNSLFDEEIQMKDLVGNDTHALVTENRGGTKSKGPYGQNKSRNRSKFREKIKCYHCGKLSHMKKNKTINS